MSFVRVAKFEKAFKLTQFNYKPSFHKLWLYMLHFCPKVFKQTAFYATLVVFRRYAPGLYVLFSNE